MTAQTIIILIIIGIAAGILSGLIGIGGGIIVVPALVYILGFSQKQAQGTSLGLLLLPVGILAVVQYYKQDYININYVVVLALSFVAGSFMGSKLATTAISDEKLKKIFAIILMLVSIKILFFDTRKHKAEQTTQVENVDAFEDPAK